MRKVYQLWSVLFIFKVVFAFFLPVAADEAYYWVWSQHLDIGYFDHPPLIAWLLAISTKVSGFENLVRIPTLFLAHASILFWIDLLRPHVSQNKLILFLLVVSACPLTGLGSLIVTPDLPLMFFWSMAIWLTPKVLEKKSLFLYGTLGAALGLAFLSKYNAVLFLPPLLLWLSFEKKWHQVDPKGVMIAIVTGLVACSPVVLWNIQNEFMSFRFQLDHGLGAKTWEPDWTVSYLLGILLIGFPTILWLATRPGPLSFLRWFAFFPVVFFFVTSFSGKVEANWPLTAYPALFTLAVANTTTIRGLALAILFWLGVTAGFFAHLAKPWIPNFPDQPPQIAEFWSNQVFLNEIKEGQKEGLPFFAQSYEMASYLYFHSGQPIYKLYGTGRIDFYDFLAASKPTASEFLVAINHRFRIPQYWLERGYREIEREPVGDRLWVVRLKK